LPKDLINQSSFAIPNGHALYNGMGSLSADITNYPGQPILCCCCLFSQQSILGAAIGMRLIITADIGTFILAVNY
jgi:hypothetical protein